MRITTAMQFQRFLGSLRDIRSRIADGQSRLASGRRIEKPSDDPIGAAAALQERARLAANARYASNAGAATGYLSAAESALGSVSDLLTQARAAGTRGASETNSALRDEIAQEVESVRDQVLTMTRTKFRERYVFSGTATTTAAYSATGVYQGNDGTIPVETGATETTVVNLTGPQAFGSGAGVLGALDQLAIALHADDTAAIRGALEGVEAARAGVSSARADVGNRLARLESSATRLGDEKAALLGRLDQLEGADLAELITRISQDQTAQEATLAAGARITSNSLFDYIG